jgi:hypothetical protein
MAAHCFWWLSSALPRRMAARPSSMRGVQNTAAAQPPLMA